MEQDMSKGRDFDYSKFELEALERLANGESLFGEGGILKGLLKHLLEASLEGELDAHLLRERADLSPNKRNGKGRVKRVKTELGEVELQTGRDRLGNFEPKTVGKWQRQVGEGFSHQVLELYSMGTSLEDIRQHLSSMYGAELSVGTLSAITDRVWPEIQAWQARPLSSMYVLVYLDALHYKVREEGQVVTKAIYTVYGVDGVGCRDLLALHIGPSEGAQQWSLYLASLKERGVEEVLFFAIDGLSGFGEAINQIYPQAIVQRCIVHMIRSSLLGVADKHRTLVCKDLRRIYTAVDEAKALQALEEFKGVWDKRYPHIYKKWKANWLELTAFLGYSPDLRRMIYTTNAVENLHRQMRKVTKTKGAWVSERALYKQLYLGLMRKRKSWDRRVFRFSAIQQELMRLFGERYTRYLDD